MTALRAFLRDAWAAACRGARQGAHEYQAGRWWIADIILWVLLIAALIIWQWNEPLEWKR